MDQILLLQQLRKGAKAWNQWRKGQPAKALNLDGIALSKMDFSGYDFSKMSIRNARLSECNFQQCDFISTDFEGSQLIHNDFSQAKLIAARLVDSDLTGSLLKGANLLTAITHHTKLEKIDFSGLDISGLSLKNISLAGSNLNGQDLARIDFSRSDLTATQFNGANLSGAIFSHATLHGTAFDSANLNGAVFKKAQLTGVNLNGFDLTKADFSGAKLSKCDLRNVNFTKAKLQDADISGAKLWNINTNSWDIAGIICEHAYWDEAGKEKTIYRPHEFERIFAESLSIELRYPYRLSDHELATLPIFIEHLTAVHWGTIIRLKSITDVAGGALVKFVVEEIGPHNPTELKDQLQLEAERIQLAQLMLRRDSQLHLQLREKIGMIREEFWPRLLELAADHERDQVRNLTILFMDLKGFSKWNEEELSEKLGLFRGLVKPVLNLWNADHPNMEGDSLRVTFKNATTGLCCACMLRDVLNAAGFQLRIGIELGEVSVIHNEITNVPDLEGTAVSMAARMEGAAEPGEVLASHRVRHYAERSNLFRFTARQVPLKKGIGDMEPGAMLECFAVEKLAN